MDWFFQLDGAILLFIQEHLRAEWMDGFWQFITFLGDKGWFWIALSLILLIPKKTRMIGFTALLALGIGALITNVTLKNLIARTRPYEVIDGLKILVSTPHDFSFPSGHSCASFAAAFACFRMTPKKWGVPAMILAALIAVSRLYVGVHYPTDVIAGVLIGIGSGWAAVHITAKVKKWQRKRTSEKKA